MKIGKQKKIPICISIETVTEVCSEYKNIGTEVVSTGLNMIFMIGVGHIKNGTWKFI